MTKKRDKPKGTRRTKQKTQDVGPLDAESMAHFGTYAIDEMRTTLKELPSYGGLDEITVALHSRTAGIVVATINLERDDGVGCVHVHEDEIRRTLAALTSLTSHEPKAQA